MLYVTGLALVSGAMIGLATGGRFRSIGQHRLRGWWLVVAGFGLQLAANRLNVGGWGTVIVLAGALSLLLFAVANPSLVGIGVVAVGVAANALVIGVDNGMPVHPTAVVAAHIATTSQLPAVDFGYRHHTEGPSDTLRLLDDRIPLPEVHEVLSFGDLILAVGVGATVAHLLQPIPRHLARSSTPPRPIPAAPAPPQPTRAPAPSRTTPDPPAETPPRRTSDPPAPAPARPPAGRPPSPTAPAPPAETPPQPTPAPQAQPTRAPAAPAPSRTTPAPPAETPPRTTPDPPAPTPPRLTPAPPAKTPPRPTPDPPAATPPRPTARPVAPAPPRRAPDEWDRWAERRE